MGGRCISDVRLGRGVAAFVAALLLVLAIALAQRAGWLDPFNHGLFDVAGHLRRSSAGPGISATFSGITAAGDTASRFAILGIAVLVFVMRGRYRHAMWLAFAMVGGTLLNLAVKQIFAAPRPDILPHLDIVHSYSFPSGHAAGGIILFGALAMLIARWWAWGVAVGAIVLMGVSRIWLGVHWPTDVLAAWIEGIGWLMLCAALPFYPGHDGMAAREREGERGS